MKRNTIIKVMSASILAASLAVVDFPTNLQQTKYIHAVGTQEVSVDVAAHLLNANNSGQRSMGDAALEKVSIKKVGNQYQYTIIWKDLNLMDNLMVYLNSGLKEKKSNFHLLPTLMLRILNRPYLLCQNLSLLLM